MTGQSDSERPDALAESVIACLKLAQQEWLHEDESHNWWANVHLTDATSELAKLRRLILKRPARA